MEVLCEFVCLCDLGLHQYDPDGRKARAVEFKIGIKVIGHGE